MNRISRNICKIENFVRFTEFIEFVKSLEFKQIFLKLLALLLTLTV